MIWDACEVIWDGYTEVVQCRDVTITYRRLTHRRRLQLKALLRSVPATYGLQSWLCEEVSQRIVGWSWPDPPSGKLLYDFSRYDQSHFREMAHAVLGVGTARQEQSDAVNLAMGVRLKLFHPETSRLSCDDCQKWWVDPLSGEYAEVQGKRIERGTAPLLCSTREGCPAGKPERQRRLSEKNKLAYEHYLECAATNTFPDDCLVAKNAKIIKSVIERATRECSTRRRKNKSFVVPSRS